MTIPSAPQYQPGPQQPQQPLGTTNVDDVTLPYYGASFGQAIKRFFKQYANFTGRASRSEYWWVALFQVLVLLIPTIVMIIGMSISLAGAATGSVAYDSSGNPMVTGMDSAAVGTGGMLAFVGGGLMTVISLALLVPTLAITWRRLHDGNFAGPFFFLSFIPTVGSIVLLVLLLLPSKVEGQRFDQGR